MNILSKSCVVAVLFSLLIPSQGFSLSNSDNENFDRKKNQALGYILSKQIPDFHYSELIMDDKRSEDAFDLYLKQLDFQKRFLLQTDADQLRAFSDDIDDELFEGRIVLPDAGYDILGDRINVVEDIVEKLMEESDVTGLTPEDGTLSQQKADSSRTYTVKKGDTLGAIASIFPTVGMSEILNLNSLKDPGSLRVGMVLKIPPPDRTPKKLMVGQFDMAKTDQVETDPKKIKYAKDLPELQKRWKALLKMQIIGEYLDLSKERQTARDEDKPGTDNIASKNDIDLWQQSMAKVLKRNKSIFNRLRQETRQDHYDRFFNAVARSFDPHTNYIPPASKEQFDINMRGSLEGIGAMLREEDGLIKVVSIVPGSASAKTGKLKAEDVILEVQQEGEEPVDISDMRLRDAVRLIRGPKGTTVTLTVKKPDSSKVTIPIVRDVVQLEDTFVKSAVLNAPDGVKVGYIYIPSFYRDFEGKRNGKEEARNSTDDTRKAIEQLKENGVQGMILDLRDDGGGALMDAVDIAGMFIEHGPVVSVKNSFGESRTLEDFGGSVTYGGPLVVLVNKFSASASEIVAAALQDYGRAVIVGGPHTHGKGTVQTVVDLNSSRSVLRPFLSPYQQSDMGALKVTIQKFYRVNGGSTQWKGVVPDIVLPSLFAHVESGERYIDHSLPWDSTEGVSIIPWSKKLDLAEIKKRSDKRVAGSKKFAEIKEEAEKAKARAENTTIEVDLASMRKDRADVDASQKRVDELYNKHGMSDEVNKETGMEPTKEEKHKKWLKEINDDPYIKEGISIIEDIHGLQTP